jgi:hypothetical protein
MYKYHSKTKDSLYFLWRLVSPEFIVSQFNELSLMSFGLVDDKGNFSEMPAIPNWVGNQVYGCGMFLFTRKA